MQSQGGWITSADGCPGGCRLGETRVFLKWLLVLVPSSSGCDICVQWSHNPCPELGSLTASLQPRWKRSRNISWGIQAGLVCRSDRQEQRLILVNAWFSPILTTNMSLSVSYSTADSGLENKHWEDLSKKDLR